jgi:hypothetical protein
LAPENRRAISTARHAPVLMGGRRPGLKKDTLWIADLGQ